MDALEALDRVESLIRNQADDAGFLSLPWRAHMADLMHVQSVRLEIRGGA